MNMATMLSIYPNGVEKSRDMKTGTGEHNPELKRKVLDMLERGVKIVRICEKLGVDKSKVFNWQESKEKY